MCKNKFASFILTVILLSVPSANTEAASAHKAQEAGTPSQLQTSESSHETARQVEKTLDALCSRANDWREPSLQSEHIYVAALRRWLNSLPSYQQERARKILREAQPGMRNLRKALHDKKSEMAELSFDRNTAPETLPRLGLELQELRATLRHKLKMLCNRLYFEAGVTLDVPGKEGCWLVPVPSQSAPLFIHTGAKAKIS